MAVVVNSTKTLEDMRNMVYFLIAESPNSTIFSTDNVDRAINMGLATIGHKFDRSTTNAYFTTVIDQYDYDIPEPILQFGNALVDAVYVDGTEIDPIDYPADTTADAGTPAEYHIMGRTLRLSPKPDAAYTINVEYRKEVTPLSDDDDTTWLPDIAVNCAIFYACYLMKLKDEEFSSADRFLAEFEQQLKNVTSLQSGVYRNDTLEERPIYNGAV